MQTIPQILAKELDKPQPYIENVIALLDEGNTIPFIARYRKEQHGSMDDTALRKLEDRLRYLRNLAARREEVKSAIAAQEKLTEALAAAIDNAATLAEVEDLYRPYKQKRRTRATIAREKGLTPLAELLLAQAKDCPAPEDAAQAYLDPEKGVETVADALQGANDIIAELLSDDADLRKTLRGLLMRQGHLRSLAAKEEDSVYRLYYDFDQPLPKLAGHQILAVNRGEKEGFLSVTVLLGRVAALDKVQRAVVKPGSAASAFVSAACEDAYDRLIYPSLEREARSTLTDTASEGAIGQFALNLKPLLMQPPVKGHVTMGLDPGYAHGCKVAVIDGTGKVLDTTVVYPTYGERQKKDSIAKLTAAGAPLDEVWLSFQEFFAKPGKDPKRWGKPMAALLGAFKAQLEMGCGSIGGKDSMSGTFENIDVPPTLVSFAVSTANADKIVSTEFKGTGSEVIMITPEYDENGLPKFDSIKECFDKVEKIISDGRANAIWTNGYGGIAEGIAKMCFGNKIGFEFTSHLSGEELFRPCYGAFIIELNGAAADGENVIGKTIEDYKILCRDYTVSLDNLQRVWEAKLEPVFPCRIKTTDTTPETYSNANRIQRSASIKVAQPRVLIPVFPGTNCEYDTARAFERAGAKAETIVIRNLSASAIEESVNVFERAIKQSQIIMLPGGFSGGDEPEGSGKFITAFFRNAKIKDAVHDLLQNRDGLMLGICNGFQALVKLGLVPFGEIIDMADDAPTLTFNTIARHQSMMVTTRIASNKSPWLYGCEVGDIHTIPISHGEGRFVAPDRIIQQMANNGQIATQYVDLDGNPTMDIRYNPNTSVEAIEGITSPDGRVLGKMGHSERIGSFVGTNVPGSKDQKIFESGVAYFK